MATRTGTAVPRPPAWRRRPFLASGIVLAGLAAYFSFGHVLPVPGVFGEVDQRSAQTVFNEWILLAGVVTSFHLVFGVAGRFAFSMAAFMGLGAYASHAATRASGLHWTVGLAVALTSACVLALAFALAVRRAQHFYFAVATLGLAEVLLLVFGRWQLLTGRSSGEITGAADMTILGWAVDSRSQHFWVLLAFLGLVLLAAAAVSRSPLGRIAVAARDAPEVLETTGVDAARPGIVLFTLGSVVAAAAGSLFVHTRGLGTPETFGIELGIGIFIALILGGLHSLWGGLIGAWFYVYVPLYLERWEQWTQVIWGAVLVIVMVTFPEGLAGVATRARARLRRDRPAHDAAPDGRPEASGTVTDGRSQPTVTTADTDASGHVLSARDVTVRFGGVVACDGISLDVGRGEVVGLTGPNGSGKSTFLNAVSGLVAATGRVEVAGRPLPSGRPRAARWAGVVRAFQTPHTWTAMSCLENVVLGSPDTRDLGLAAALLTRRSMGRREQARWAAAADALDRVGLADHADAPAATLTYGQRRMLELARCMAACPTVLLLDEPAAGLNQAETTFLGSLLRDLQDEGVSVLVVDHKIDFLDALVDRLVVLELGRVIASGRPDDVWRQQAVIDAYLGTTRERRS